MAVNSVEDAKFYYQTYDVENRIKKDKAHMIEFLLSMSCIDKYVTSKSCIIDIGCGTGNYSVELAKKSQKVLAVDLMDNLLQTLREKIHTMNYKNISCLCVDVLHLPKLINEKFDLILCMGPLYHLNNKKIRKKCYNNLKQLAKDNARIIFTYLTTAAAFSNVLKGKLFCNEFIKLFQRKHFYLKPFYFSTPEYIEKELKENAFVPIEHIALDPISSFCSDSINYLDNSHYNNLVQSIENNNTNLELLHLSSHNMIVTKIQKRKKNET